MKTNRRRVILLSLFLSLALLFSSCAASCTASCSGGTETGTGDGTDRGTGTGQAAETEAETVNPDDIEDSTGSMQGFLCVSGPLDGQENAKVTNTDEAKTVLQTYLKTHGYRNAWNSLSLLSATVVGQITYYRFAQYYKDSVVLDRGFVLAADDNGSVLAVTGNGVDIRGIPQQAKLAATEAPTALLLALTAGDNAAVSPDDVGIDYEEGADTLSTPQLCVYADEATQTYSLVWRIVFFIKDEPYAALVDTQTGSILQNRSLRFTDTAEMTGKDIDGSDVTFTGTLSEDGVYSMNDAAGRLTVMDAGNKAVTSALVRDNAGKQVITLSADGKQLTAVTNKTAEWTDDSAVTAMYRVQKLSSFFAARFGCAPDTDIYVVTNNKFDADNGNNAYTYTLNGQTVIGLGTDGLLVQNSKKNLARDVLGHEYTHIVLSSVCGLQTGGDSGAIAEAYADLFGELFEDWEPDGVLDNTCDWVHGVSDTVNKYEISRSIFDPEATGNPQFIGQNIITDEQKAEWGFGENEVHHLSTVVSHAAWSLLSDTFTPDMLADLLYRTLYLLPSDASFTDLRRCMMLTASMTGLSEDVRSNISLEFDRACIYGYSYAQELTIEVYDRFERPYPSYTVEVSQSGTVLQTLTGTEPTFSLRLEPGNYTLTMTDGLNTDHKKTMVLRIGDGTVATSSLLRLYFLSDTRTDWETVLDSRTVEGELPGVETMTEPIGIRAMDNILVLPKELILLTTGQTEDGRIWRKYGFTEGDMGSQIVRTLLYIGAGDGIEESLYLLFSRADGTANGGNYDEIYRKAKLEKKLVGWSVTYEGGTILTLVENASNSGSKFSYTESESNPEYFLYFDNSAGRMLSSDEWREIIHFSERFELNDDANLPASVADAVAAGFQKLSKGDSKYHQFDASLGEWDFGACLKFVRQDGKEAVYLIVTDCADETVILSDPTATKLLTLSEFPEIGPTFNYALNAFDTENFITNLLDKAASASIAHYYFDMIPYYWWGNHPDQIDHTHTVVFDEGTLPTCTATGLSRGIHCEECGKVILPQTELAAVGHNFADGICTVCGEADPDYETEPQTEPATEPGTDPVIEPSTEVPFTPDTEPAEAAA